MGLFFLAPFILLSVLGCISGNRSNECVKNAYMMFWENEEHLGRPSAQWIEFIDDEIGRSEFVRTLRNYTTTKYRSEVLYCLGWFGDERDIPAFCAGLEDSEPEIQRICLNALAQVSHERLEDIDSGRRWCKSRHEN